MRRVRLWKRAAAYVAVAVIVVGAASRLRGADAKSAPRTESASSTTVPPPAPWQPEVTSVRVRSGYENAERFVSRDIGLSVALPGRHALWIFGDTGTLARTPGSRWQPTDFIDGSTAMVVSSARGKVPRGGVELPAGEPSRFVPPPTNVSMPDGSGRPCAPPTPNAAFAARWPTGAALMPADDSQVIVTFVVVCVVKPPTGAPEHHTQGWGYLLYNWRSGHIDRGPVDVLTGPPGGELPVSRRFGWPVFADGKLTLFSSNCSSLRVVCSGGNVWSATLAPDVDALDDPASYEPVPVRTDGSASWQPLTISVGKYDDGLRLVEQTSILGGYRIFEAPAAGARWRLAGTGTLPGCRRITKGFCFGLEGHPELSTATSVFASYKDPNSGPNGHVVVSALRR